MKIGLPGTGRMGAAIVRRLIDSGHQLTVWNRTADKLKPLIEAGASAAASPKELAEKSEVIITILSNAEAIDSLYEGPNGFLAGNIKGKLFIEMSTVRPEAEIALDKKVRAAGAALIECPVGGTVGPAREGKLLGFVGGEDADVARARPVLEQMCRRVEHVGKIGAGASMKLAINLPLLVYWQSLSEALSLIQPLGLDPARVMDILADTSGGPNMLKNRAPAIAKVLKGEDIGPPTMDVNLMCKDMRAMIAEAKSLGRDLPVTERALNMFDKAAANGMGEVDAIKMPAYWLAQPKQ
ncbi:MAG TPA: NAD(P)-dependent oxidoreductase [Burkholderiales bacterium]|jgi:3-hydroxyisobutyrate dehydrogenase|nr:NAD(P)-dependent oxidoreductase [Burkholderiales bacterium]